ncbi:MAG: TlpA family protein disulfide reductase [Leptospirales bacterium]
MLPVRWGIFFFALILAGFLSLPEHAVAGGKEAPNFRLHDMDGQIVQLHDLRGNWVLLNFWATWCAPCLKEIPALDHLSRESPKKLIILGISESLDGQQKLLSFLKDRHVTYRILKDSFGRVADHYGVRGLPDSVLIDPDGRIRWVIEGAVNWTDPVFQRKYLSEPLKGQFSHL